MQEKALFLGSVSVQPSLLNRLANEFKEAFREFRSNPTGYLASAIKGDGRGGYRRQMLLRLGLAIAATVYISFFAVAILLSTINGVSTAGAEDDYVMIGLYSVKPQDLQLSESDRLARGGGGGGDETPMPPSKGAPPPFSHETPLIAPTTRQPIQPPVLAVVENLLGDPNQNVKRDELIPTGLLTGVPGPPSDGPGSNGGIGTGKRGGAGSGEGPGSGPGEDGGQGGGPYGDGGRPRTSQFTNAVDSKPIALNRPRPNYTEEARKNKVQGVVQARVLVGSDGRALEVRVIRGLPSGLNEEAIRAAMQMRFKPPTKDGRQVQYWVTVAIEFNIR
jgi:periplasmic protein TonB